MAPICSSPNCSEPGGLLCTGCRSTRYCSKACQKTHWKTHKVTCKEPQKYNCFIIRAAPKSDSEVLKNIPEQIVPLPLQHYGTEHAEKRELTAKLDWGCAGEVGKFYDHIGSDHWYYYVYGDVSPPKKNDMSRPRNEIGNLVGAKEPVYGDMAVVRSGPLGSEYPECFTHSELCKAVEFQKNGSVFAEREKSRFMRKMGMDPQLAAGIKSFHINI